ncbi:cell envelope integrity protein TolA [Hydrogenophaga aromaticivorans]|uniref:cell envelope integrity protein TolA n=1 Tax=Hydrogenophaga aromaticivorans TaxID=2610898 RepID=UPI001B363393|nr:cell envelope integrity protein TolA [Hydrogenophaga aromaticivorans]MBQ0917542.1 cell envelope integrity protein TolA [Hydrogenophaga aromaticivorans]
MQITADTHDLKPPRPGRWLGPVGLALLAHALLMGALTWGVHWKDEPLVSFEAELWSAVPREAAPRAVQPPPPPPPPPEPEIRPEPKPKPEPRPVPPPPPAVKEADIATAQAKKKAEAEKREEAKKVEAKRKAEAQEKEKEAKKEAAEKLAAEKKAREKKLADQKAEKAERAREVAEEKLRDQLRREQVARMMGQVGASGNPDARGSAARSSGPSSGYGNRVRERIRPNIRISQELPRNLLTEIEVRTLADGTISSRRVVKSSGNPAWDDAALRAIDRTGSLPRDTDGTVPSPMIVEMRPLD